MQGTDRISTERRSSWAWLWLAYTAFLFIEPILDPSARLWIATLACFAVFLGIFTGYVRATGEGSPLRHWMVAATFALGLLSFPWNQGASTFFVYTAAFLPFSIQSVRRVLWLYALECAVIVAEGYAFTLTKRHSFLHTNWADIFVAVFLVLVIGCGNIFLAEQRRADCRLRLAQEENAALAALAERERIARDLHDVLGHTLSVIVLKAELAGRLLERDPVRAAQELTDVERTARTALAEVREAIGGYRAKGLPAELELARNTLVSAGVALSCETPIPRLNAAEETVLSLAVREAVTNIVRHARARHCRMTFATTADGFHSLRVEDDGAGISDARVPQEGNGLRGMRERVQSLGGRFSIQTEGGTRLIIELPGTQSNAFSAAGGVTA